MPKMLYRDTQWKKKNKTTCMPKMIITDTCTHWNKNSQFHVGNFVYNSLIKIGQLDNVKVKSCHCFVLRL